MSKLVCFLGTGYYESQYLFWLFKCALSCELVCFLDTGYHESQCLLLTVQVCIKLWTCLLPGNRLPWITMSVQGCVNMWAIVCSWFQLVISFDWFMYSFLMSASGVFSTDPSVWHLPLNQAHLWSLGNTIDQTLFQRNLINLPKNGPCSWSQLQEVLLPFDRPQEETLNQR